MRGSISQHNETTAEEKVGVEEIEILGWCKRRFRLMEDRNVSLEQRQKDEREETCSKYGHTFALKKNKDQMRERSCKLKDEEG